MAGLAVGFVGVLVGSDEAQAAKTLYLWAYGCIGASLLSVVVGVVRKLKG